MEEVNPLKSDPELQLLLRKLDQVKKYRSFQRWKSSFLSRLEEHLYEEGIEPAEKACHDTEDLMKKMVKKATKVLDFIHKGDLGEDKKTVRASLALNEMCKTLQEARANIETLVPSLKSDEKRRGFTKFHVGAALIRQGFHQYISMKAVEDAVKEIGEKLKIVADKQQHELFSHYKTQVQRFCDVMADLDMYKVMLKCVEFAEEPDDESEEPEVVSIIVETADGKKSPMELELGETVAEIMAGVETCLDVPKEQQVLKFNGDVLEDIHQTVSSLGLRDGSVIKLFPRTIPIIVNGPDGRKIELEVDPNMHVSDLKRLLEPESGIPVENQVLTNDSRELKDPSVSLNDCGIKAGAILDLQPTTVKLNIAMPDGSTTSFEVTAADTGDDIKSKVAAQTGIEISRQVLTFKGKEILADSTVKGVGIQDGTIIQCELFKIPITVETHDGKTIQLKIEPIETIDGLKGLLENEVGLPPRKQVLKLTEEELIHGKQTATSYGIKKGSVLTLEPMDDKIVFVDVKCGTLFGVDRDEVIEKAMLTPHQGSRFDFHEAEKSTFNKDKMMRAMLNSPRLGVKPQIVVEKVEVEDYDVAEAEQVKNKWGVSLKKKRRDDRGEEFMFVDVKTGSFGLLDRQDAIAKKFITPAGYGKDETLQEAEPNAQNYDKFVQHIRNIFGIKTTK